MKCNSRDRTGEKPDCRRGDARAKGEVPKKRIVICADGTWNDPEDEHPTNVMQIARAIRPEDANGVQQVVFYDWGVGSYHRRLLGGMIGLGLAKNIQDCYRFIVHNYDAGDEIFLFGFSRGAYTVRSVAGLLNKCGILPRANAEKIPCAYRFYKTRRFKPGSCEAKKWRKKRGVCCRGEVHFVGVWDTVGSLGIPESVRGYANRRAPFFDSKPGSCVRVARHAVAIDEKRADFAPTLWTPKKDEGTETEGKKRQSVKQVWFAGVHSDIGGGRGPKGERLLSDLALAWMATEAELCGLALECHLDRNTCGLDTVERHLSYKHVWRLLGRKVREIPRNALVHQSVKSRHDALKNERIKRNRYEPEALKRWLEANGGWDGDKFEGHSASDGEPIDEEQD